MNAKSLTLMIGLCCLLMLASLARGDEARQKVPWLDIPASWTGTVEGGMVSVSPDDLSLFDSLVLRVDPLSLSTATLDEDYEQALRDLGSWRPIGNPVDQRFDNGWIFRMGVGVATLEGTQYTAETTVARHGNQRVRFWVLADSDTTFNRYKPVFANAISSAQDITLKQAPAHASAPTNQQANVAQGTVRTFKLDPSFGKGISGVYVGLERGLSLHAGSGLGTQQTYNTSTGSYEQSMTAAAPQAQTSIEDFTEVDVFFPHGIYRRRLPDRGMNSDMDWDQQQWKALWGTWKQQGNKVIISRGSYTTSYTIGKNGTLISDRDRPWSKVAIPANSKLEGTFARDDYRDATAPRLTLHADGRYEEHGNFLRMVGSASNLVVPDGNAMLGRWNDAQFDHAMSASNGSYAFDSFTLTFHASDGRIWQINAYVPPGENMTKPRRLVINGRALLRDQ
jgi:hypothetical protein